MLTPRSLLHKRRARVPGMEGGVIGKICLILGITTVPHRRNAPDLLNVRDFLPSMNINSYLLTVKQCRN